MCKSYLPGICFFSFLLFIPGSRETQAQQAKIPPAVLEALQRYSKLDSATWSWEGSLSYLFDGKTAKYSTTGSYVRFGQKFAWSRQLAEGKKTIADHLVRFDGSSLAESNDGDQLAWYDIKKISKSQPTYSSFIVPYFDAIGIHYPRENASLESGQFKSKILHLLENDADLVRCVEEKFGDKQVTVIELEAAYEAMSPDETNKPEKARWIYYLSNDDNYAVVKHERRTLSGKKLFESEVRSFSRDSAELPILGKGVTIKDFVKIGEPEFQVSPNAQATTVLMAKSPQLLPTRDEDFVLKKESAKAGAMLIDAVTPELQNPDGTVNVFSMPASPEDLDKAIAAASVKRSTTPRVVWVIGMTVLIVVGIGVYFRYRSAR